MTSWRPTVSVYKVYILQIQFHASVVAHRSDVLYQCCDVLPHSPADHLSQPELTRVHDRTSVKGPLIQQQQQYQNLIISCVQLWFRCCGCCVSHNRLEACCVWFTRRSALDIFKNTIAASLLPKKGSNMPSDPQRLIIATF